MTLGASVVLMACGAGRQSGPRHYAQAMDSASSSCGKPQNLCTAAVGEKMPVVPPAPVRPPMSGWPAAATAAAGGVVIQPSQELEPDLVERIDRALSECANEARSQVMLRHFKTRGPTREECEEEVGRDSQGQPVTRAMRLGVEQHAVALECAERKLRELKPGGYSLSPRYRYDPSTGKAEYIPAERVKELLSQGRSAELRGTLEPDIVIHEGTPRRVQAVYDYKFPCVNTDEPSPWRRYPKGHLHAGNTQGAMYKKALGVDPARVQPHVGVSR
jgi:hypothetical protein